MQTYAGIDLHSSNNFIGVINEKDKILDKRLEKRRVILPVTDFPLMNNHLISPGLNSPQLAAVKVS